MFDVSFHESTLKKNHWTTTVCGGNNKNEIAVLQKSKLKFAQDYLHNLVYQLKNKILRLDKMKVELWVINE